MKPRLLDLFCGAGGAAVGYDRAGFEVVGVDIAPQPNYPFTFFKADALEFLEFPGRFVWPPGGAFDAIHASPPCQAYTVVRNFGGVREAPDLVAQVREGLQATGLPYVIENVPGAPLQNPVMLCGSSFGLGVRRHRLFETNFPVMARPCAHGGQAPKFAPRHSAGPRSVVSVFGRNVPASIAGPAMDIDWMTNPEMGEAVPPAYTEHVGAFLVDHIQAERKAALESVRANGG